MPSPPPTPTTPIVRQATESDLPALLTLLLTSFRQFPLFSFLYAPLDRDRSAAHDTVFFWRRRLLLDLLDPNASIMVAEVEADRARNERPGRGKAQGDEEMSAVVKESWQMLEWVEKEAGLRQESRKGWMVVGFAIWGVRVGGSVGEREKAKLAPAVVDWRTALRVKVLNLENCLWGKFYQRRDQDRARYRAYLEAEEDLSKLFYTESCYYLDNLAVDFRYQRLGIGRSLLEWGIDHARGLRLPVQTEAGPMGVGLYRKAGFEQVGIWKVKMVGSEDGKEFMELPVMRKVFVKGGAENDADGSQSLPACTMPTKSL